jgi:hypothetical protein
VVFPSLCLGAASELQQTAAPALGPGEMALITEDGPVRFRFWTVEAMRKLRR